MPKSSLSSSSSSSVSAASLASSKGGRRRKVGGGSVKVSSLNRSGKDSSRKNTAEFTESITSTNSDKHKIENTAHFWGVVNSKYRIYVKNLGWAAISSLTVILLLIHTFYRYSNTFWVKHPQTEAPTSTEPAAPRDDDEYHDFCTLYMAPSSIPNAGLGVYAGIDYTLGDVLTKVPAMAVVVDEDVTHPWIWRAYTWNLWTAGASKRPLRSSAKKLSVWWAGLGSLANSHAALFNIVPRNYVPPGQLWHGGSSLQEEQFHVSRNISAGDEIFCDYGNDYLDGLERDLNFWVPRKEHFDAADVFGRNFVAAHHLQDKHHVGEQRRLLQRKWNGELQKLSAKAQQNDDYSRSLVTLPQRIDDLRRVAQEGTALSSLSFPGGEEDQGRLSWLRQHGHCIDTVTRAPTSRRRASVPHADNDATGVGAFSTRPFATGQVILVFPVLPLQRHYLQKQKQETTTFQSLLNYCFGHVYSSLLFCPYWSSPLWLGPHQQQGPNAKIQWSTSPHAIPETQLQQATLHQVVQRNFTKEGAILMDLVATRPIEFGDEIVIDYGNEWERARERYEKQKEEEEEDKDSSHQEWLEKTTTTTTNNNNKPQRFFATLLEQEEEEEAQASSNATMTGCFFDYHYDVRVQKQRRRDFRGQHHVWTWSAGTHLFQKFWRPCHILERYNASSHEEDDDDDYYYTVQMLNGPEMEENQVIRHREESGIRSHVPWWAIRSSSSTEHRAPFRHERGVPHGMYPSAWMDLSL